MNLRTEQVMQASEGSIFAMPHLARPHVVNPSTCAHTGTFRCQAEGAERPRLSTRLLRAYASSN